MPTSATIMTGLSRREDVIVGMKGLDEQLRREREWYRDAPRLKDDAALVGAVATGRLVRVEANQDIQLIGRFRNPALHTMYPPYLSVRAKKTLHLLGRTWRQAANLLDVPLEVRLSATSFTRHDEYQAELVAAGKFAVADSTHVTGEAFDIDLGGYFLQLADGREAVVSLREVADQEIIAQAFEDELSVDRYDPVRLGPDHYDHRVSEALFYAAELLHDSGVLNAVIEMPDTPNRVLHTAPAPE